MRMKKLVTTSIITLLLVAGFGMYTAKSQSVTEQKTSRFGLFGDVGLFQHSSDFRGLPGLPTCCPRYDNGTGTGLFLGVVYDIPLSTGFSLNLRGVYSSHKGTFTNTETRPVLDNTNTVVDGIFEHRLETTLGVIGFEPIVRYSVLGNLAINGGATISYALQKNYTQQETILSPSTGTFGNGKRVELQNDGAIPQSSSIGLAALAGLSYDIPLSKAWTLAPEFLYTIGLTNEVQDLKWTVNAMRFGATLFYQPQPSVAKEPIIEPEKIEEKPVIVEKNIVQIETPPNPPKPTMTVNIQAVGMDNTDTEVPLERLRIEEFISTQMYPLLNYVFFDDNSAEIPARYNVLHNSKIQEFTDKSLKNLQNKNSLEVYYDILNVVGFRMSRLPKSKLTLTGCNSNLNAELGNLKLSEARAEAVKNYLVNTWNIAPNRITTKTRNLPEVSSNIETGVEENRRVELSSTVLEVLDPIIILDTLRTTNPPSVKFLPSAVIVETGVKTWNVVASQQGKIHRSYKGDGEIPRSLIWRINDEQATMPRESTPIDYTLNATDKTGQLTATSSGSIPVEFISIERKQSEKREDKYIDRYNLILFDFDRATITPNHKRIIDFIGRRTTDKSTIGIVGYTDLKGTLERNQSLQLQRANAVAKALNKGAITVKGSGDSEQLFDNALPEGRFYNRTVVIEVETPIEK